MFREKLNKVFVDGKPVKVAENTSTNEILKSVNRGNGDYMVATEDDEGVSEMLPSGTQVRTRDGQRFESVLNNIGG